VAAFLPWSLVVAGIFNVRGSVRRAAAYGGTILRIPFGGFMSFSMEWRPVGDVLVVQCKGRIVAGKEVLSLHHFVGDSLTKYGDIVLEFDQVEFVDSSGLGAMVRLVQAARAKGKDVKLSGLQPYIHKTLKMTNLLSQFEVYGSVEEAITAAYLRHRYCRGAEGNTRPLILCIYDSFDMCTFLRELLCSTGYNALTAGNVSDGRVLLKATKAKLVVISSHLQMCHGQPTKRLLEEIDPAISILILEEDFGSGDPGESAEKLLNSIGEWCGKHAAAGMA
jgi:anti-anti-sigma factor